MLSTKPYKGARDFFPQDMKIRNYMFNIWRKVCEKYGYEEYDFPILEPLEIFTAKTGEEIVNEQLFSFEDRGGRKLAIRPEITPGTVRMIADRYNQLTRPIRWFMLGNNYRYEKPQLGRGREFYQLEVNVFGVSDTLADFEIFSLIIDIMKEFGANETQFKILVSDRRLILALLTDTLKLPENNSLKARRIMDKRNKVSNVEFLTLLTKDAGLTDKQANKVTEFMDSKFETLGEVISPKILNKNGGYNAINKLFGLLKDSNLDKYVKFEPSIIRGFDYSDGLVYEVFDTNPNNKRSLFGGERFDKLINIFGNFELPATGFAMGDITLLEFLKGWNLLPTLEEDVKVLVTVFPKDKECFSKSLSIATSLRSKDINTQLYLDTDTDLTKQIKYANKKNIPFVIIVGPDEVKNGAILVKDMVSGNQIGCSNLKDILKLIYAKRS